MMTITLLLAGTALAAAMGIYDAYKKKRSVLGWIVSIAASVVGGVFLGVVLPQIVISIFPPSSNTVAGYVGIASVVVGVIAGSAIMLWLVNRFR